MVLQQQAPVNLQPGNGGSGTNITVNENTEYQTFTGGGASFTDTAAWLMKGSGALSQATRDTDMTAGQTTPTCRNSLSHMIFKTCCRSPSRPSSSTPR